MMLIENAYHVLGLDTSATQKEIRKRAKEILNFLMIEESPIYDVDISLFSGFRKDASVKQALHNLSNPRKRIIEWFFWFNIVDEEDERAMEAIKKREYNEAIKIWEEAATKDKGASLHKKNLAVLLCVLLMAKPVKKHLKDSIRYWKDLVDSEKFWPVFNKLYKLEDDLKTSDAVIEEFKDEVKSILADVYAEISQRHKDNSLFAEFTSVFKKASKRLERSVLNPVYEGVHRAIASLESIKIEDDVIDQETINEIKMALKKMQSELNKLIELGLYEDGQTIVLRDKAASAIRTAVLSLYEAQKETDTAVGLLKVAVGICGTTALKRDLEKDVNTVHKNKEDDELLQPVIELIKEKKFGEALKYIEEKRKEHEDDKEICDDFDNFKKHTISAYVSHLYDKGNTAFNEQQWTQAEYAFENIIVLVEQNADLFNYNIEAVNEIMKDICDASSDVIAVEAGQIDEYRKNFIESIREKFGEHLETGVLIMLFDSHMYLGLFKYRDKKKRENTWNSVIGWAVLIGLGLLFGLFN